MNYKDKFKLKDLFISLIVIIILFGAFFLLLNYKKDNLAIAGENYGGWSYDNFFGWTSESCNNLYDEDYNDYCRIDIDSILDVTFDSDDIDFSAGIVKDNVGVYPGTYPGTLVSFVKSDVRNGGKGKSSGEIKRDSNFDNSLYFDGTSYINFGAHNELSFDASDFTTSLWFKIDPSLSGTGFLFSNGNEIDKRYHCWIGWIDPGYYLFCIVNNQQLRSNNVLSTDRWNNVSIVNESGVFSMYLNGFLEDDTSLGFMSSPGIEELILGANGNYATNFKGELDEFRFFNNSLNADQILHNTKYNSNYLLNIEDATGKINGWVWSNGIGWICFGDTCSGTDPEGNLPEAELHWFSGGGDTYPHMITGWANAVVFNDPGQEKYKDTGWMSLQSPTSTIANYDEYDSCVSCNFRDEENELVMYFKMDEDAGPITIDSSGFANDGTLGGNFEDPIWTEDGKINNCLNFDGIDDYVEVDVAANEELKIGLSDFSIEAWIKNEKEHDPPRLLSIIAGKTDQQWELYFDSANNRLKFNIFGKIVDGPVTDITNWSHVVVVGNRTGNLEMYIDNVKSVGGDISGDSKKVVNNTLYYIGKNGTGSFWDDKIDIVRIYTRALSAEEVSYNYDSPEKRFCSACLNQTLDTIEYNDVCYECERCELDSGITDCKVCSSCRQYGLVFDTNAANIKGFAWGGNSVDGELVGLGWFQFSPMSGAVFYRSYVSARYGSIYSKANIGSDRTVSPPDDYFNATYMIQANGHIMNWVSSSGWYMSSDTGDPLNYKYPKFENDYGNILGNLDYLGLTERVYGEVVPTVPDEGGVSYDVCLDNKVYFVEGADVILEERSSGIAYKFENCANAAGTIIIDGDLTINADIKYNSSTFSGSSNNLASVAWIIKGDLKIGPDVEELAGTFIVLGKDGIECGYDLENPVEDCGAIFTCNGNPSECGKQLQVSGQFLAKNFNFERTYRSLIGGDRDSAEEIIYDGRNVINPPPGLGDVLKSLPTWNQIAPY